MLALNSNFRIKNDALAKKPVYVAEIFFNGGNSGVDGINDIYFATCDVTEIVGFSHPERWFPFLKASSIGSMSQTVDPINGVSSIGSLDITITDHDNLVSDIIKAADTAGHGLRRQRLSIYMLYKGMDWADKVVVRTMQINDLRLSALNEYKLTAADVQRQLQKTVFNPYATVLAGAIIGTGAITPAVVDSRNFFATTQQVHGLCGFVKIDDEIMRWTVNSGTVLTIAAADRGLFGSVAATHSNGAKVSEIIVLQENPVTMALKVMQSTGEGSNGAWDVYPARWGCGMDSDNDVNVAEWLEVGKLLVGLSATPAAGDGVQFEFVFDQGVEAKKFVEDMLLKILGAFGFVHGDGRYGIRAYSDLSNAAKENASFVADQNSVIKWGDLTYNYNDLANQVWIEYDEAVKLSGKYIRNAIFIDSVSIKKWGEARQLKYAAPGIIPTSAFASQLYQRFQRIGARYSRPPMQIELTMMPKYHGIEIGDIARVTLPIRDLFTGAALDRAFEVISTQLSPGTGQISIKCLAQPERATFWFGGVGEVYSVTVSPAAASIVTGQTQQLTARAFDGLGNQVPTPAIAWVASGNVTVDASGLVTAGAVGAGSVFAVVGSKTSNVAALTVIAAANANTVASVVVSPSVITLEAPQTQQVTAQALDITGTQVNDKVFNWASSNPAAATVPAGPSASAVVTAVANGATNITAQESISLITSANVATTIATPQTPDYTPPALADSAYQVGTQITAHGPVGGPHVIPDGYDFAAGDYWYDGSVSLAISTTCTINGTVRIFSLGTITINGTVDGDGRGTAGTAAVSSSGVQSFNGIAASAFGFVGLGGLGGSINGVDIKWGGSRLPGLYPSSPMLNINGATVEPWTAVTGLPNILSGSQATSGAAGSWRRCYAASGAGGASGAGLLLMARGIYITTGIVYLRGGAGGNASTGAAGGAAGGGGGGGGGSLVCLIERNLYGLPPYYIDLSHIYVNGGVGGGGAANNGATGSAGGAGGSGASIQQVIG